MRITTQRWPWIAGLIALAFVLSGVALLTSSRPLGPGERGVFVLYQEYSSLVLELRADGRFRYWSESDVSYPGEPGYPVAGRYLVRGDTVFLLHPRSGAIQWRWALRQVAGQTTLWRPDALRVWEQRREMDRYGVLVRTEEPAEQAWAARRARPAPNAPNPALQRTSHGQHALFRIPRPLAAMSRR